MASKYDDSSIDMLIGAERIRTRPASMLGSNGLAGARHGFTEIYGNALDERSAGYGDKLDIRLYEDGSVSIRDYGRGVPLGWNDNANVKNWNWHSVYNELYGGGKYDNGQWFLRSIDTDASWSTTNLKPFKGLHSAIKKEYDFDIMEMEVGETKRFHDYVIFRESETDFRTKVQGFTWATLTWELLNKRLNYLGSVGLNGLGAASTQYTSEFFSVKSYRDGKCTSRSFKAGVPLVDGEPFNVFTATAEEIRGIKEEIEDTDEPNGTFIRWKPDATVFSEVDFGDDWLFNTCKDIADVAGIELHFKNYRNGVDVVIPAGNLRTLAIKHCGNNIVDDVENPEDALFDASNFQHGETRVEGEPFVFVCKCDVVFAVTKGAVNNSCYHNSVKMLSGMQYDAISSAISEFMQSQASKRGLKLERTDYENTFGVFVSTTSNYASFRNQTKDAVDDWFIFDIVKSTVLDKLQKEYGKGNRLICDAIEQVMKEAEIRVATKEYAQFKRESERVKRVKAPEKFASCKAYEDKNYAEAELWITEGDSANGAIKNARNKDFQATFPIRGKGLNVLKSGLKRILQNKEIRDIFSLIGTGFDLNIKGEKTFNIDDLRFDKIIFATDADEDGYQIRVLLFLVFYKLAPDLIREGHVYIAETPRFSIKLSNGDTLFAKNDANRDEILKENAGKVVSVSRFKGLGEVDEDVLSATTVHPDTRNLIQLTCDLENDFERDLIDALFGMDKYKQRKEIVTTALGMNIADILEEAALVIDSIESDEYDDDTEVQEVIVNA